MEERVLVLNKLGFNIVKIINPLGEKEPIYYIYDSFVPVDTMGSTQSFKHIIKGRDVTKFLHDRGSLLHLNLSQIDENVLRTHISAIPAVHIEYSSHYLWENFLSV